MKSYEVSAIAYVLPFIKVRAESREDAYEVFKKAFEIQRNQAFNKFDINGFDDASVLVKEVYEVDSDMLFVEKTIFGDKNEHNVNLEFRDGIAFGRGKDSSLFVTYPMMKDLTEDMKREMDEYQGIYNRTEYTYRDICLKYGTLQQR